VGVYGTRQADGVGACVRIDNDFDPVFEAAEFDDVARGRPQFERFETGSNRGLLKFAADIFGHSGKFCETTDGATGGSGEARIGIEMKLDAFQFSGHECPRG